MAWDKDRPRARQGKKLSPTTWRRIVSRDRRNGAGCYFMYLDICTGLNGKVEVHHIIEVEDGGTDLDDNLAAACKPCHTRWSARQAQKRATAAANDWKRRPEKHPGVLD
jgi:5-methylcytosine-specific restriction endonuclease McrA